MMDTINALHEAVVACRQCERLVTWREQVAREKVKRFEDQTYWGKAVPSFGDPMAEVLIVGLAPAAHGANRTGRMFTGDRSGDWLYKALHKAGFANQPTSVGRDDGLALTNCYISAVAHCAPPGNKPLAEEVAQCRPYLVQEFALLTQLKVVIALGKISFDAVLKEVQAGHLPGSWIGAKPTFGHGAEHALTEHLTLLASYHPSQQNTFTGRLTEPMFDAIFERTQALLADAG